VSGTDWAQAPHVTDAAILEWLCERHCGRPLRDGELDNARRAFVEILRSEVAARPERFAPIAGAPDVFARLHEAGWQVAVATGGWETTARLKLETIGLRHDGLALASASDARTRAEIIRLALGRVSDHNGGGAVPPGRSTSERVSCGSRVFDTSSLPSTDLANGRETPAGWRTRSVWETRWSRVVSLGDGVWDVRTAAELRLPFIGIGSGERAERLRDAGAETVLADLRDTNELLGALERAGVPA
jgi:phosphoglycolate phosphatase-like HAD superfamily hydrolase